MSIVVGLQFAYALICTAYNFLSIARLNAGRAPLSPCGSRLKYSDVRGSGSPRPFSFALYGGIAETPYRFAIPTMVLSSRLTPFRVLSNSMLSSTLWLTPPVHGVKIMPIGATLPMA